MTNQKDKSRLQITLALIVGLLFVAYLVGINLSISAQPGAELKTTSTLSYCSNPEDSQCQKNVATLDYRILSRDGRFIDIKGYPQGKTVQVLLKEVTLKFTEKTKTIFDEDFFLYADSDGDGLLDVEKDRRLARSLVKKRRIIFEDIDFAISEKIPKPGLDKVTQFFIYSSDHQQNLGYGVLETLNVVSSNLSLGGVVSQSFEAFADKSVFDRGADITLSKSQFLKTQSIFKGDGSNKVKLPAGDYELAETVVIPKGLDVTIEPGVNLEIAQQKSLVSYSPVQFLGTAAKPINITNRDSQPFGVIGIIGRIDNQQTVNIRYTNVSGGSETEINGAYLSGMMSVYRIGTTNVTNSSFKGSASDDGLNIKYSEVYLKHNRLEANSADAFDGDFVSGTITENTFIDNGNDSVDFSGSNVSITFNSMINSADKCVSIGENTKAVVRDNLLQDCSIGVVVKDRSSARIFHNVILNSQNSAIDSYLKKAFFGDPSFQLVDNVIIGSTQILAGLAPAEQSGNITSGKIENIKEEITWVKTIFQTVPTP